MKSLTFLACVMLGAVWGKGELKFPQHFKFGAATSSYQIEGGWDADDKTPNIWDVYVHMSDGSNGDVACDSYNKWKEDIQIASDLGLDFYRFSISWTRVLPKGTPEYISKEGSQYYSNLINGLLEKGIEPVVTIYHWDLPQRFQELGGWANPRITDWLADYAKVLFKLYGDRVKTWITLNEPFTFCNVAYTVNMGPGKIDYDMGYYQCVKNTMVAHGKAAKIYHEEFRKVQKGRVGIVNHHLNLIPETKDDEALTELANELLLGVYSYPIYSTTGGWPPAIERILAENSKAKGFSKSILPEFTKEEKEIVKGSADFFGLNYYTSRLVRKAKEGETFTNIVLLDIAELGAILDVDPSWKQGTSSWFYINPKGIRDQLSWIKKNYGDIEIIITENGYSSQGYNLHDDDRISYMKDHLDQVLLAIYEDKINVTGYTAWSLMDNFEWGDGYVSKFGLYEVDFTSPNRTRTPRDSAHYYTNIIRTKDTEVSGSYLSDEF